MLFQQLREHGRRGAVERASTRDAQDGLAGPLRSQVAWGGKIRRRRLVWILVLAVSALLLLADQPRGRHVVVLGKIHDQSVHRVVDLRDMLGVEHAAAKIDLRQDQRRNYDIVVADRQ